jgi:plasmid stabilization system protein ParE
MARLVLLPGAAADLDAAAEWYEREREGLGADLLGHVDRILGRIEASPHQFPLVSGEVRRGLVTRFPYGVFFVTDGEAVVVIAVLHLHRRVPSDFFA